MKSEKSRGEALQLTIRDLNSQGQGVTIDAEGKVCFVDGGLPGEVIAAKKILEKKNYAVLSLEKILQASVDRVDPRCNHFGECGGCDLQHLSYPAQVQYKAERVRAAFSKLAQIDIAKFSFDCEPAANPYGYRNKLQMPYRKDKEGRNHLGMYRRNSHHFIPIRSCKIHNPKGERILAWLSDQAKLKAYNERTGKGLLRNVQIRTIPGTDEILLVLVVTEINEAVRIVAEKASSQFPDLKSVYANINKDRGNRILSDHFELLCGQERLTGEHSGIEILVGPNTFLQINNEESEKLYSYALESAELKPNMSVADLYCGIGVLTNRIAGEVEKCVGYELSADSIENARLIAENNSVENVEFFAEDVLNFFQSKKESVDVIFVDPPRKGCDAAVIEELRAESDCGRIIYISCDPGTLARDIQKLCEGDCFQVKSIRSFDLFPQTAHVETVVRLDRTPRNSSN